MRVVISIWPTLPTYYTILTADINKRREGQIGSINLEADSMVQYYRTFHDQNIETRKAIERQVNEFVAEQMKLRAVTERLLS